MPSPTPRKKQRPLPSGSMSPAGKKKPLPSPPSDGRRPLGVRLPADWAARPAETVQADRPLPAGPQRPEGRPLPMPALESAPRDLPEVRYLEGRSSAAPSMPSPAERVKLPVPPIREPGQPVSLPAPSVPTGATLEGPRPLPAVRDLERTTSRPPPLPQPPARASSRPPEMPVPPRATPGQPAPLASRDGPNPGLRLPVPPPSLPEPAARLPGPAGDKAPSSVPSPAPDLGRLVRALEQLVGRLGGVERERPAREPQNPVDIGLAGRAWGGGWQTR
jgi:hypothetical protein